MPDFLLELRSEEIPARMQVKACTDLARLFVEQLSLSGLDAEAIETHATPRRLALIARGLPAETAAQGEELKGPRASAPPQALEGFLRKTGLSREQLVDRDGILFAIVDKPGRPTAALLAEAIPAIFRAFPWPKSMRWGAASASTESPRWVRPLQGIVALFGEEIVAFEIAGIASGAATVGHRFHHPGPITIGGAHDYAEKLRACHVILDASERAQIIADGARAAAAAAGLTLVEDEALVAENAGLTEWPVPLLGRFDPAFLDVPAEVIQLTMRTNQKYFACRSSPSSLGEVAGRRPDGGAPLHHASHGPPPRAQLGEDQLAPNFICTANIEATDGGAAIVAGNERVLSARLADAKFFWEQDLKIPLEDQAAKLAGIVFHEKLGTLADKVERVAKLATWLVEEGIVKPSPLQGRGRLAEGERGEGESKSPHPKRASLAQPPLPSAPRASSLSPEGEREHLAALTERAARLCKADLVTQMVGEFPELQGIIGAHLARAQGEDPCVADAIRDHYKPVGQGDEVPTDAATIAVSLADKLDTFASFFAINERPTGSRDPFAIRRSVLGAIEIITHNQLRVPLENVVSAAWLPARLHKDINEFEFAFAEDVLKKDDYEGAPFEFFRRFRRASFNVAQKLPPKHAEQMEELGSKRYDENVAHYVSYKDACLDFFADRLKIQQREAGIRHDLIDAVFALGGEDDLVRLLARVKALQGFVETPEGRDLLAGYKRAANILKKEGWAETPSPLVGEGRVRGAASSAQPAEAPQKTLSAADAADPSSPPSSTRGEGVQKKQLSYTPEAVESSLIAALDSAEPKARAAIGAEAFEGAMAALASLRGPVDSFFESVTVNDPDPAKREARLALLARMRDAVHTVADFSKIEG